MAGTVQGPLTDLERANYTEDSTLVKSIIYTRNDGGTYPVTPDKDVGYFVDLLTETGGSADQNVDGSVTPVTFSWSPNPAFGEVLLFNLKLVLVANNISDFFDYGNRSALTNGLLLQSTQTLGTFEYATIFNNTEFFQYSNVTGSGTNEDKGNNSQDGQLFNIIFDDPIKADSSFSFEIIVRDDLTGISWQRATAFYRTK